MTLTNYIEDNVARLSADWQTAVSQGLPKSGATASQVREAFLRVIVAEMRAPPSEDKHSRSRRSTEITEKAKEHAIQRLKDGFTVDELIVEYRALRATIVDAWSETVESADRAVFQELVRFEEILDNAIAEAIIWFNDGLNRARDLFVGVLGHDLRDPLSAVRSALNLHKLAEHNLQAQRKATDTASRNVDRMAEMIDDLLDFARTRLGGKLPLNLRDNVDMEEVCNEIMESLRLTHEGRDIRLDCLGELKGQWDVRRIRQVVSNLAKNALDYGEESEPVVVVIDGRGDEVILTVHNEGTPIAPEYREAIFDPLSRGAFGGAGPQRSADSLGLGLYIVKQIAEAHGGSVELESDADSGTTFRVRLPRNPTA